MKNLEKIRCKIVCVLLVCLLAGPLGANAYTPMLDIPGWDGSVAADFAGGHGTKHSPFLIENAAQLAYLAQQVNHGEHYFGHYFSLVADIDLANQAWIPIGEDQFHPFSGTFNGNGHRIFNASQHSGEYAGLFGNLDSATVMNLGVTDVQIDYWWSERNTAAGILAAAANDSTILNCYASNFYICAGQTVGGIVGTARMTVIENCYSNGQIRNVNRYSKITGGIAGSCYKGSAIKNCYSTSTVEGYTDYTANWETGLGAILGCYLDDNAGNRVSNCYWLEETLSMRYPDNEQPEQGVGGGAPDPTKSCSWAFMQSEAFLSFLNNGGDAYRKDADGTNRGYPVLTIAPQSKSPAVTVVLNGAPLEFPESPIVERERVLVPGWPLGYALGVDVSGYDGYIGYRAHQNAPQLAMQMRSRIMTWGDERILLDVVPRYIGGYREYVPIRAVMETLGASVTWEQETGTVYVSYELRGVSDEAGK